MKIKFGNIVLCAAAEKPKNFSVTLRKKVQSDDIISSQKPIVSDRGNAKYTVCFTLERAHKNSAEAERSLFDLIDKVSSQSPSMLEISFDKNSKTENELFENAVMVKCVASADERITNHAFEFTAGKREA